MKIALIAPFEEKVPPEKYGGTELVIYNLSQKLADMGHRIFLIGTGDSEIKGEVLPVFDKALRAYPESSDPKMRDSLKFIGLGKILEQTKGIKADIIHNHLGWRLLPFLHLIKPPVLTTLHGPMDVKYQQEVYGRFSGANYVSISDSQRRPFPSLNYTATVYNGIDIDIFPFSEKGGDYLAFLGRTSPEKGIVEAIMAAKECNQPLKIAAKVDVADIEYFETKVKPLIDGRLIQFIGEVDHKGKIELLRGAKALLGPIQWEEPFGLYFTEAMACGTPVLTVSRGSVPEIVVPEKTGFCSAPQDQPGICASIKKVFGLEESKYLEMRKDCRKRVEENFTSQKMAEGYLRAYEKILA